jgi:opacity protein-like surface antigen
MKRFPISVKGMLMVALTLAFLTPINALAKSPFYFSFKPGIYSPQSGDLDGFDTGFSGEIALGYHFNRNIAVEFGIGYFNTEGNATVVGATYVAQKEFDIEVVPVTFTLKAILPYKKWEFFGLGGGGIYLVSSPDFYDDYYYDHHHNDYDDDYDAIWGGYLGAGIHYNITPNLFIGVEGKYLWTEKVSADQAFGIPSDTKFKMDGFIATAVIGIRF